MRSITLSRRAGRWSVSFPDSVVRVSKPDSQKNRNEIIFLRDLASSRMAPSLVSDTATVDLTDIFLLNKSIQKSCRSILLGPGSQKSGYRTTMFTDIVEHVTER